MFLRALCVSSPFNDSFCRSHKVNVFKLTVIELWTVLWGFEIIFPVILYHVPAPYLLLSSFPALLSSVPCSKTFPSPPLFFPELRSSPWEVIYNAIGLTIIRLHTISPCPRSSGRLLRSTILFAQKHIFQPCLQNLQGQSWTSKMNKATLS